MATNVNGHVLPAAFASPGTPYYAQASGGVIAQPTVLQPTLVAPITLQGQSDEGGLQVPAKIDVRGDEHTSPIYVGAVAIRPGGNDAAPTGSNGIVIRAIDGTPGVGTAVEIGTEEEGPNHLYIEGADGQAEVYDEIYNQVIKTDPVDSYAGSIPANTGPGLFEFTPFRDGAYMLQVNFNVANADSIPVNGAIEWTLTFGEEVQFVSNTIKSTSMVKASDFNEVNGSPGALAEPMDFCFTDMCFLTAGITYSFNLFTARNSAAGGGAWAISGYQVRVVQMC